MNKEDYEEPFKYKSDSDLIFGANQNLYGFPNPDFIFPLNEEGFSIKKKLPDEKKVVAHYWLKQKKTVSAIGFISALILVSILIQETGIFDKIFVFFTDLVKLAINSIMGLFG